MAKSNPAKSTASAARPTAKELAANLEPGDLDLMKETVRLAEQGESAAAVAGTGEVVRVYHLNRSKGSFIHGDHRLDPGGSADVPQSIADIWLGHKDAAGAALCALSEAAVKKETPAEAAEKARLAKELEAAKGENAEMDARIKALETQLKAAQAAAKPAGAGELPPLTPTPDPTK